MKKVIQFIFMGFAILLAVMIFRTLTFKSKQVEVANVAIPALPKQSLEHFQAAISYKTISFNYETKPDSAQFTGFRHFLEKTYPLVHQNLKRELVNNYSMLFEWKGKNAALKPVILMAHQDVVPIEVASKHLWKVDPFAGIVKDDFIWGRGTVDDKINLISIMEGAEKLLASGFQPERSIYFVFGHDEELSGQKGAIPIAKMLADRGVKAEFVLDEGGMVTTTKVPNITKPAAMIATAEKGYMSIELSTQMEGGHSSSPAKETAIDLISRAINKLRENQPKARITSVMSDFFDYLGPEMPFLQKMIMANQWITKPILMGIYEKNPQSAAMMRTTTVPTILTAGIKDNVIPMIATATVNFRILQGEDSKTVLAHVTKVIDDERVKVKVVGHITEPSKITSVDSEGFKIVSKAAKQHFDGAIAAPFLLIGATDSRYFTKVSENIIKFSPMIDPIGFHTINERVSLDSYKRSLAFFEDLMKGF